MMEFGKTLRTAREAKGYTALQLAELTRLAPSIIEELENEDFSHIAAPIYGRGFVKLYCEAVGLAAKPLIDQFMDILNGDHEPRIRERPVVAEPPETPVSEPMPEPAPEPMPEPIPTPPPQQDLFRSQTPLDEKKDLPSAPPAPAYAPPAAATEPTPTVSKYASSFRMTHGAPPQYVWRTGALVLAALALLLLLFFGLKTLHRATAAAPEPTEVPAATEKEEPTAEPAPIAAETAPAPMSNPPKTKPSEPRTAQDIPSLYID